VEPYEALLWHKRLTATELTARLNSAGLEISRPHAWRLVKGLRSMSVEQRAALDQVLALGAPAPNARGVALHPLYAVARVVDGDFVFLFSHGGRKLPLFVRRELAEWAQTALSRGIADVAVVPVWIGHAARVAAEQIAPEPLRPEHLLVVEAELAKPDASDLAREGFLMEIVSSLRQWALLTDADLLSRVAEAVADTANLDDDDPGGQA
jgi:hypothetical protein